jgi:hypothetical protein
MDLSGLQRLKDYGYICYKCLKEKKILYFTNSDMGKSIQIPFFRKKFLCFEIIFFKLFWKKKVVASDNYSMNIRPTTEVNDFVNKMRFVASNTEN